MTKGSTQPMLGAVNRLRHGSSAKTHHSQPAVVVGHKRLKPRTTFDEIAQFRIATGLENVCLRELSTREARLHASEGPLRVFVSSLLVDSLEIQKIVAELEASSGREVQLVTVSSDQEEIRALFKSPSNIVISSQDLAVCEHPSAEIARLRPFALLNQHHALAIQATVSLSDLRHSLVLPDENCFSSLSRTYSRLFIASESGPHVINRYSSPLALMDLVYQGAVAIATHGDYPDVISRLIDDAPTIPIYLTRSSARDVIL